jgi:hypothetical protein
VWFRRGRLLIVSPDSLGTACPLSGRNSTYRPVQISETSSVRTLDDAKAKFAAAWGVWLKAAGLNEDTPTAQLKDSDFRIAVKWN